MFNTLFFTAWFCSSATLASQIEDSNVPLNTLTLPQGFGIEILADAENHDVIAPREIQVEQYDGVTLVYVGTYELRVYILNC